MGLYPHRCHPARAARVYRLLPLARWAGHAGFLLRRHIQNGAPRSEPLAAFTWKRRRVLVPRKRAPIEHGGDYRNAPTAEPRRVGERDYVGFVKLYRPHFPDCFKHRNHPTSVATLLSVVTVYDTLISVVKQTARDAVTPRADVQSGVSAMNNSKHNRQHPRPPGLIRAGGLIRDDRRPPGQRPTAQRPA